MDEKMLIQEFQGAWDSALGGVLTTIRERYNGHETFTLDPPHILELLSMRALTGGLHPSSIRYLVLQSPGGAGKNTTGEQLEKIGFSHLPRVTDRSKRVGEIDGKDYHFVSTPQFEELLRAQQILVAKKTYGHYRGYLADSFRSFGINGSQRRFYLTGGPLSVFQEAQKRCSLDLKSVLYLFLLPPSLPEWVRRLNEQLSNGYFSEREMMTRFHEGFAYIQDSVARADLFPQSCYLVNDSIDRVAGILRRLLTTP